MNSSATPASAKPDPRNKYIGRTIAGDGCYAKIIAIHDGDEKKFYIYIFKDQYRIYNNPDCGRIVEEGQDRLKKCLEELCTPDWWSEAEMGPFTPGMTEPEDSAIVLHKMKTDDGDKTYLATIGISDLTVTWTFPKEVLLNCYCVRVSKYNDNCYYGKFNFSETALCEYQRRTGISHTRVFDLRTDPVMIDIYYEMGPSAMGDSKCSMCIQTLLDNDYTIANHIYDSDGDYQDCTEFIKYED